MQDLRQKALSGAVTRVGTQAIGFVVRLSVLAVLARLLEPRHFGLMAMVTAITGFLDLFRDMGLSVSTISAPSITREVLSASFWVNLMVGTGLGVLTVLSGPFLAGFYREPELVYVTAGVAVTFLLNGAGVQDQALLQRELRFRTLAAIELTGVLLSASVGLLMAFRGFGYWSLVGMAICPQLANTVGAWMATRWIPAAPTKLGLALGGLRLGGTVTLIALVAYLSSNSDKIMMARFWGADALGVYSRAYQISAIPVENLNVAAGSVAFASFARLQSSPERLSTYFRSACYLFVALLVPACAAFAVLSREIVGVLLGAKWTGASSVLMCLAPATVAVGLLYPTSWLLPAIGLAGRRLMAVTALAPILIGGYWLALPLGPERVALTYSFVMLLWVVPNLIWSLRRTPIPWSKVVLSLRWPVCAGCVAAGAVLLAREFVPAAASAAANLAIRGGVLVLVYAGTLVLLERLGGESSATVNVIRGFLFRRPA